MKRTIKLRQQWREASPLRRRVAGAILLAFLLGVSGCTSWRGPIIVRRPQSPNPSVAVMPRGHVHTHDCGHFYHDGRWYYLSGHRHGPGCGHVFANRTWRLLPPREERTRDYVRRQAAKAQVQRMLRER